jgi:hypothetical protein
MTKAIAIYPDKRVEEIEVSELADYQAIVLGLIEAVGLADGSTMYVNEEFLLGQFGPEDFNSIASDVCGLAGRPDLMLSGILGPVLVTGPIDDEGYDTDITEMARRWIHRVRREAVA